MVRDSRNCNSIGTDKPMLVRRGEGKQTMSSGSTHRIAACLQLVEMAVDDQTLDKLFSVIEEEIASSSRRIESASHSGDEWFLGAVTDDECDSIEQLLGWAFVAAQTFTTTVRSRLVRLSAICNKDMRSPLGFVTSAKGHEVLKLADPMRNNPKYSEVEVINAIANYWKHQEEWPTRTERKEEYLERVWDQRQMRRKNEKRTIEIVASIGMSPSSTGNLRTAYKAFGLTSSYEDLSAIRDKLRNWAHSLHRRAQSEIAALRKGGLKKGE